MGTEAEDALEVTFVDNMLIDTGVETPGELETLMLHRIVWRRSSWILRQLPLTHPKSSHCSLNLNKNRYYIISFILL